MNIVPYIKAKFPILYIETPEEARAELCVIGAAKELQRVVKTWSITEGFTTLGKANANEQVLDPIEALTQIKDAAEDAIYVFRDLHTLFSSGPQIPRLLRDIARDFKQLKKTLILISPVARMTPEIERDITLLQFELPKQADMELLFKNLYAGAKTKLGKIAEDEQERIIQAAMGLTTIEAENAIAKAMIEFLNDPSPNKAPISKRVLVEKAMAVRKTGVLEYFEANQTAKDIGGLDNLKQWLNMRAKAFSKKAREFGLPMPRGILLVGIAGCGKSLSAKAASNILGVPLLKFDVGRVFGGIVGESEANIRRTIQTAEAVGPSVLWVDEMEKAFAGMGSANSTDGGTTQRVFGNFLTWMQEKTCPCFVIATVNRLEGLPPELLRKGRFDEIFFVGLPSAEEREEILNIHVGHYGRDPKLIAPRIKELVNATTKFSGAEIEEAVVSGLYTAFYHERELQAEDILKAANNTIPLSKSRASELEAMAKWAQDNAVNASRVQTKSDVPMGGRQLEI